MQEIGIGFGLNFILIRNIMVTQIAFLKGFPKLFSSLIKYIFYSLIKNKIKQKIYFNRISGFLNAAINKKSWYRSQF